MADEAARTIGCGESQLFLDDTWIADSVGVGRVFHQARKFPEPVLRADRPWEEFCPVIYGTVLEQGGRLRLWYKTRSIVAPRRICYAESSDGITWEKPALGLVEFGGSRENNICISSPTGDHLDGIAVIDDPEDGKWPLKAVFWHPGPERGIIAARSGDGLCWDWTPGLVLPGWGDRHNAMPHKDNGKYVVLGRAPELQRRYGVRVVARSDSEDLVHWSKPRLILKPDAEDDAAMQFYSAVAFRYESLYVGFIERMHMCPDKLDTELVFSHDGWTWRRTRPRGRFIEWGQPQAFDDTWITLGTNAPIRRHGQLWFYYSGRSLAHGSKYPENHGALGLATLRIDGFASLQAKDKPGWVETPPMRWPGGDLLVNVDPRRDLSGHYATCCGEVRVEVRGGRGRALKGYSAADCAPLVRNTAASLRQAEPFAAVQWGQDGRGMARHKGKVVSLRFEMRDAHLYSFKAAGQR